MKFSEHYDDEKSNNVIVSAPKHWVNCKIKHVCEFTTGWTPPTGDSSSFDGDNLWANISDLGPKTISSTSKRISSASIVKHGIPKSKAGSLLFSYKLSVGQVSFAGVDLYTNEAIATFYPSEFVDLRFAYYAFPFFICKNSSENIYGAKILNQSLIKNASILMPPLHEQRQIADVLDHETSKIDTLIEEQRRLVALLSEKRQALISHVVTKGLDAEVVMKNSSFEWIGQVPQHWCVPPLYMRYSCELGKMLDFNRIIGSHLVPYLRNVDVQWDSINYAELPLMDIEPQEYNRYTVRNGDLLVCEGGEVGRAAVVHLEKGQNSIGFQKALHRLRPRSSEEDPRYMFYTLACAAKAGAFSGEGQSTIAHLTGEQLRKYRFPQPPISEQIAISQFLDHETGKLDALIQQQWKLVTLLAEKRQAIITAAVTGKIDVRGFATPSSDD